MTSMRALTLLIFLLTLSMFSHAQHKVCGTDEYTQDLIKDNTALQQAYNAYLDAPANDGYVHKHGKKAAVDTIPIVFHVIHEYGDENISKEQILSQVKILNDDFQRLNDDRTNTRAIFQDRAADVGLHFKLATKDPDGNCTDGITRTVSSLTDGGDEEVKKLIRWNYRNYLNIWVVKNISRDPGGGNTVLGYARLPFSTSEAEDGIVILADFVGNTGTANATNAGRTLTHEVGHWLGLLHPFQDSGFNSDCGGSNCLTSGDRVCDTPPVLEASFGCNTNANTCTNDVPDLPDMIENFMDYADGRCANMFTEGQKDRMWFYLNRTEFRGQNISVSAERNTGIHVNNPCAPKPDFHVVGRNTTICAGGWIEFEDYSWNGEVTDVVWTFEGGSPSTSTFSNPTVKYNTPGTYKVTLKASNAQGENSVTKTEFITVLPEEADIKSPFIEEFESQYSPLLWDMESDVEGYGWKILDGKGFSGKGMVAVIDENAPLNQEYNLYSPAFDLSLHERLNPVLSFRTAYSMRRTGTSGERIVVYGSDDCGQTWKVLGALIGISSLKSVGGETPGWEPSNASDWKVHQFSLDQHGFEESTNLILRFALTSNQGNSVFIDDVNVDRNVLSTEDINKSNIRFDVVPNPSSGQFTIKIEDVYEPIHIEITDILGQNLQTLEDHGSSVGHVHRNVSVSKPGVYLVRVYTATMSFTKRIIVSD